MTDLKLVTRLGSDTLIAETTVEGFKAKFRDEVLRPQSAGYDETRAIWNAMIDRHPALIAWCTGTADVLEAVRFAREHDLLVSVQGGGRNIAGLALCENGLPTNFFRMNKNIKPSL